MYDFFSFSVCLLCTVRYLATSVMPGVVGNSVFLTGVLKKHEELSDN